jgi:hypothetical protein
MSDEFDPNRDTQTSAVMARFDDKGRMWDMRNIEKLVMTLLEQRDWHQMETSLRDLAFDSLQNRLQNIINSKRDT